MLKDFVQTMLSLDEEHLERIAFLNEPMAHTLSCEQKHVLAQKAQDCGRQEAVTLQNLYGARTPEQYVELCSGVIKETEEPPEEEYTLFASFERPNVVTINTANTQRSEQLIADYGLRPLLGDVQVRDVLLSHELYHLLESRMGKDSFVRQKHACFFEWGRLRWMRRVGCLEEIAAMAFAQQLMKLPYSPYVFNIVMLYAFHPEQALRVFKDYTESGE